jgi:hypothetical protein
MVNKWLEINGDELLKKHGFFGLGGKLVKGYIVINKYSLPVDLLINGVSYMGDENGFNKICLCLTLDFCKECRKDYVEL